MIQLLLLAFRLKCYYYDLKMNMTGDSDGIHVLFLEFAFKLMIHFPKNRTIIEPVVSDARKVLAKNLRVFFHNWRTSRERPHAGIIMTRPPITKWKKHLP